MPRSARSGARTADTDTDAEGRAGPAEAATDVVTRWRDGVFDQVRERPARTLLLAVGTGYIVGGGIGTILTARLLALGARMALRLAIIPLFASEIERALFDGGNPASSSPNTKRLTNEKETDS